MSVKKILEMIESVSIDDADKLDEIDARVWCYENKYTFVNMEDPDINGMTFIAKDEKEEEWHFDTGVLDGDMEINQYTRSRDALKRIRPDGWYLTTDYDHGRKDRGDVTEYLYELVGRYFVTTRFFLPTEELAELHAIIQAKEWEKHNETI